MTMRITETLPNGETHTIEHNPFKWRRLSRRERKPIVNYILSQSTLNKNKKG